MILLNTKVKAFLIAYHIFQLPYQESIYFYNNFNWLGWFEES